MNAYLIQAIGFVGVALFILSYQIRSNRALYVFQALGSFLFFCQFFLMGQFTGSFNLILIILRNLMLTGYRRCPLIRSKGWPCLFASASLGILIVTWRGPISLLPFAATVSGTLMYWTDNAQRIRLANLVCASPCWLAYDILVGSWGGILNESITLASILISIKRFGWKAMGDQNGTF